MTLNKDEQTEEKSVTFTTMGRRSIMLNRFKKQYKLHVDSPTSVYKLCLRNWMVILSKVNDRDEVTVDNESRKNVLNPKRAKHRASVLFVDEIVRIETGEKIKTITNVCYYGGKEYVLTYTVGQKIYPDKFDPVLENVCSSGIHYYLTMDQVFETMEVPDDFTGTKNYWNNDGSLAKTVSYVKGKMNGLCTEYYPNGRKSIISNYENGEKNGSVESFWKNGSLFRKGSYVDGKEDGIWVKYSEGTRLFGKITVKKPRKASEGMYVKGKKQGKWISYYTFDGSVRSEGTYVDDNKEGMWKEKNFRHWGISLNYAYCSGNYKNGERDGTWIGYYNKECTKKLYDVKYENGKEIACTMWKKNGSEICE